MSKRRTVVGAALAATLAAGALTVAQTSANADGAPSSDDVVGVGSDIIQNSVDFLADGDIHGHLGYNAAGNKNRLISFDSTADANGRNAFLDPSLAGSYNSTTNTGTALNPTVVLRAGTSPVQRPNGGGAGLTALINDGKNGVSANKISFVRSPNLPTAAQQSTAQSNLGTPLHTVQIGDDKQVIATATTTNAPSALSAAEIVGIYNGTYKHWNDLPGNSSGSSDAIIPLIPQVGAGVRTIFTNALKAANGNAAVTLTSSVRNVQQNDPTTITGLSSDDAKNAIVPFPVARFDLVGDGYFLNPNAAYSASAPAAPLTTDGIKLEKPSSTLQAPDGAGAFSADLPYYIIFRESDAASDTPWQPGGTLNWVQTLFLNPGGAAPYVNSAPGKAILTAAGVTPKFDDLGNATNG